MHLTRILRPLGLAAAIGYSLIGCSRDEQPIAQADKKDAYTDAEKEADDGIEAIRKARAAEKAREGQPSTATTSTTSTDTKAPTTTQVPTTPTAPVSPGQATPVQPAVPSVTRDGESRIVRRAARRPLRELVSGLSYFSVTDPQNFISAGGHGSKDDYGGFANVSLDGRLSFLRGDLFLGYSRNNSVREGKKDLISDLGIGRGGVEFVFDNKDVYLGLGPMIGANYVEFRNTIGNEPKSLRAVLAGGRVRGSIKGLADFYGSGLQSLAGDYDSDAFEEKKNYKVRELTAGAKIHLGKGISVGGEAGELKEENEDLAKIWKRRATGYVELKDIAGSGVSAWIMGTGYRFHARHDLDNELLEARIRFLADLGNNLYLGGSVYGNRDKLSEKNNSGGEASLTYKLK